MKSVGGGGGRGKGEGEKGGREGRGRRRGRRRGGGGEGRGGEGEGKGEGGGRKGGEGIMELKKGTFHICTHIKSPAVSVSRGTCSTPHTWPSAAW